ncbi:MAG: hypothetical protein U5K27_13685 [Desulfotignum sp.]|nr:hypothetical protein [Desulfotignum sp.]
MGIIVFWEKEIEGLDKKSNSNKRRRYRFLLNDNHLPGDMVIDEELCFSYDRKVLFVRKSMKKIQNIEAAG